MNARASHSRSGRRGPLARAGLLILAAAPLLSGAGPARLEVRWAGSGDRRFVEVSGLGRDALDRLAAAGIEAGRWKDLLRVAVRPAGASDAEPRPMLGSYRVEGDLLRFRPRFPLEPGVTYEARFDPSKLPGAGAGTGGDPVVVSMTLDAPSRASTTSVVRVDPTVETLPENLLKFYLTFSAPMSRGEAYRRIRLLDASGTPIDAPFLELGQELWDPSATRLTLLLDPGRIKTGLRPHDEAGPVLEEGRSYTLVVDPSWPDAKGNPLVEGLRKPFRVGPPDRTPPDPSNWKIQAPRAGTRGPLVLTLPEPLDRALVARVVTVVDPEGRPPAGRVEVGDDGLRWSFLPEADWREGEHRIVVGRELEDLAGNSVARPFEVDVFRVDRPSERSEPVTLRFRVAPREGE